MEQFHHGHHVRLRSRVYGTYLHADEDGHGVCHRGRRASMGAVWAVHLHEAPHTEPEEPRTYLLLHSAANGRYLAATNEPAPRGLHVEQRSSDHPEVEAIIWQAILTESGDGVYLHQFRGGRLRASGSLHWNTGVSVDDIQDLGNITPNMHWVVEAIPARAGVPRLPGPTALELSFNRDVLPWRMITYMWPNVEGALVNHNALLFRGRSVFRLRDELAWRLLGAIPTMMNVNQLVMCLPTRDGRFFPLVVDLPRNQEDLLIVVVVTGAPAHVMMRYADVNAG